VGEDGRGGTEVATVSAEDPDGRDNQLGFHLHSFVINSRCGLITVAQDGNLDIQRSGDTYDVQVGRNDKTSGSMLLTSYI
jgi:type IV secretory pathway TrbF-like protein